MGFEALINEIHDANLTYLMLAQQMILGDRIGATFRLGINTELADVIAGLSAASMMRMARTDMLLARFRLDERAVLGMLNDYSKDRPMVKTHSAILLSHQPVELCS
jgi:flagellar transcriptional activator FlhD